MLQEYLDQLFDAFKEGICISDVEGTVVHLNRRHAEITGIPREEMLGHSVMEFVKRGRLDVSYGRGSPPRACRPFPTGGS